ncbi:MAG: hypothetical protein P1U56_26175 [Saprospiraceae bacterium]|nr:hypothetical protein [Saprospiraceae bacterium]
MKYFVLTLLLYSLVACSISEDQINSFSDCVQIVGNYNVYNGEEIDCQFHYVLTQYDNQQFLELVAHCADLTRPYIFNTNCEDICESMPYDENSACGKYLKDREVLEILFIEK